LVKVAATAINRADTLQRRGKYPVPPGESEILGLEVSGEIVALGAGCQVRQVGERVCGLLGGGGHTEFAVLPEAMALPLPAELDLIEAAAIPEVFLTAFQALDWLADLQAGETLLVHAGASGVGTAAIQLARAKGAQVVVTASAGKHALCQQLGAAHCIDYRREDFAAVVAEQTGGKGVEVILDFIAAPYFQRNLDSLALDGRLVMLALLGGGKPEAVNLLPVLRKRLQILGSTLRNRPAAYKAALSRAFWSFAQEGFATGQLKPVIDRVLPWEKISEAHRLMEANENAGKVVLTVSEK
jgi:putative PIG3 family NAD(P)H quinone oxidoreductase